MIDEVKLEGLEVGASVGVYDHERGVLQRLVFDVAVACDLAPAGQTDALADALDYDRIAQICREVCASGHHQLIETIADKVARGVHAAFPGRAGPITVRVQKPGAVPDARTVAVTIRRASS